MPIQRSDEPVDAERLAAIARDLLHAAPLCAVATVSRGGRAHVSSAYFAWSTELDLVWVSDPRARHSRNLRSNRSAAVAVCDSNQAWGGPDRGIQLFGVAGEVDAAAVPRAEELYRQRFPAYRADELGGYRLYRFRPQRLKLFDERELGAGVFVTATVLRAGRLRWKRTEVYRASPPEPSPPG